MERRIDSRFNNYDLLRCICIICVVIQHTDGSSLFHRFLQSLAAMAVPCFVMLSGAMVMEKKRDSTKAWYAKMVKKLVFPWLIALTIYILENFFFQILYHYRYNQKIDLLSDIRSIWMFGYPLRGWHLWFMYMFIELYLLVPIFSWIKQHFRKAYYVFGLLMVMIPTFITIEIKWPFLFLNYVGLFILGDIIHENREKRRKVEKIIPLLLLSILIIILYINIYNPSAFKKIHIMQQIRLDYFIAVNMIVLFSCLRVSFSTQCFTRYIFYVYILHILVGDFYFGITSFIDHTLPLSIILDSIVIILISFGLTISLNQLKKYIKCKRINL